MSDEKPTCEHGKAKGHYWITDTDITSFGSWCSGPVIATAPETPASDPTPDLRETIGWALAKWIAEVTISDDSDRFDVNRGVELVLSALGEPK